MVRTLLTLLLALTATPLWAADAIRFADTPTQNRYVRVWTSATAAVADEMSEGSGAGAGRYVIADSALVTAGLSTAGVYSYKVFSGATASTTANDECVGVGTLYWTGSTAETEAQYLLRTTTSDTGSGTLGRALHYLRSAWVSSGVYSTASLANAPAGGGGGGVTIPVNQVRIAESRTWVLKPTSNGLVGEVTRYLTLGDAKPFAIDFRNDLSTNGQLTDVNSIIVVDEDGEEIVSPGITFAATATDPGVNRTQAIVTITGGTAGTYRVRVKVEVDESDGGGESSGTVTLVVAP